MHDLELTRNILQLMATLEVDVNNSNNSGGATPEALSQQLRIARPLIVDKLKELTAEGHTLYDEEIGLAFLADSGRQLLTDIKYKNKNIGSQSITFNAPVYNSNIIQGDNASSNITVNFLNDLQQAIEKSSLSEEKKKTWGGRIKEITSNPILLSIVTKALEMFAKSQMGQ